MTGSPRESAFGDASIGDRLEFAPPPFRPLAGLGNTHLQNLSLLLPRWPGAVRRCQRLDVELGEEGKLRLWCHWQSASSAPTIVILHGLTGSAASSYVIGLARKAFARGFHVIRFNARGSAGTEHLARPMTHCGLTADVRAVLARLRDSGRCGRFHLVGFSMGANLALKLAGEWGRDAPAELTSVVAVSPAVDVRACAEAIDCRSDLRLYRRSFLRALQRMLRRHATHFDLGDGVDLAAALGARTIRGFDAAYTVPAWGFVSVDQYWDRASALHVLPRISVPTLVIAARDDLLVPFESLAPLRRQPSPTLRFIDTAQGGHCAFFGRTSIDPDRFWAENRALQFAVATAAGG